MPDRIPSPTALRVAALRALHQTVDMPPVFVDPLAERMLGPDEAALLDTYRSTVAETSRLRGTLAVRTVIAEETIAAAARRGILVPPTVSYVAANFERDDLFEALGFVGFDRAEPAVFVMLGVVPYVAADKVLETFRRIASDAAGGSEIVFDYTEPLDNAPPAVRANYEAVAKRVAAGGEPWVTFFAPAIIKAALRDRGFSEVIDMDAATLSRRFCDGRTDGLSVAPLVHLVRART